jgi:hypothetical protein
MTITGPMSDDPANDPGDIVTPKSGQKGAVPIRHDFRTDRSSTGSFAEIAASMCLLPQVGGKVSCRPSMAGNMA